MGNALKVKKLGIERNRVGQKTNIDPFRVACFYIGTEYAMPSQMNISVRNGNWVMLGRISLLIAFVVIGLFNGHRVAPQEMMTPRQFISGVNTGHIISTSGEPLELQRDPTTGQRYLLGFYYQNQNGSKYNPRFSFRVPISADPDSEALNAVRKAGMEVINSSDMHRISPGMRRFLEFSFLIFLLVLWCWLLSSEWQRKKDAS